MTDTQGTPRVVAALPGNGWVAELAEVDDQDRDVTVTAPVIAWLIHEDGFAGGLVIRRDGFPYRPADDLIRYVAPGDVRRHATAAAPAVPAASTSEDRWGALTAQLFPENAPRSSAPVPHHMLAAMAEKPRATS